VTAFSADAARSLPGPPWLAQRRAEAAERFAASQWPSTDEEVWRYSRIAELDLDAFALAAPSDVSPPGLKAVLATLPPRSATVVTVNGHVSSADGPYVSTIGENGDGQASLGSVITEPVDLFSVMNDAFAAAPVLVRIPRGAVVDDPIVVVHWIDGDGTAAFPRLVVEAGADSQAAVLEIYASAEGARAVVAPLAEIAVGPSARLGFTSVQEVGLDVWQIASQVSQVDADATFTAATAGLGGDYARHRTDCRLTGRGATGTLLAVYFGEGDQTLDFRTFQEHAAPDTTSNLLFKGAVGGRSRSVYTGLIRVRKNAHGTNALQTNRNIKLSDDAWAESVPNLEIENNDVRCSHASAVGPIDEDQRFYLESRGVPPDVTERLVVTGFFDEVLQQLPVPGVAPSLRVAIAGKLDRSRS